MGPNRITQHIFWQGAEKGLETIAETATLQTDFGRSPLYATIFGLNAGFLASLLEQRLLTSRPRTGFAGAVGGGRGAESRRAPSDRLAHQNRCPLLKCRLSANWG